MRARNALLLACGAFLTQGTARPAELNVDFRREGSDNASLKLFGRDAEQFVRPTERGLLLRIPPNEGIVGPIGLATRSTIRGDFEITAEFELLRYDRPREGAGVGVELVVEFSSATAGSVGVGRLSTPGEGERFRSSDPARGEGVVPGPRSVAAGSRTGKLRLVRKATTVGAYYADGAGAFRLLREQEVGEADVRVARFGIETGSKPYRVEALLKSLTVTAGEFIEADGPPGSPASGTWIDPVILSVAIFDVVLIGLAAWRLWPARAAVRSGGRVRS